MLARIIKGAIMVLVPQQQQHLLVHRGLATYTHCLFWLHSAEEIIFNVLILSVSRAMVAEQTKAQIFSRTAFTCQVSFLNPGSAEIHYSSLFREF